MKHILIVEDDEEVAMLERGLPGDRGLSGQVISDGGAAEEAALTGAYDLILLDLMLPGRSGYEVCRRIRDQVEGYSQQGSGCCCWPAAPALCGQRAAGEAGAYGPGALERQDPPGGPRTLRYFADQGVDLKVISGDNAVTVANIARKAGLEHAGRYVDASTWRRRRTSAGR